MINAARLVPRGSLRDLQTTSFQALVDRTTRNITQAINVRSPWQWQRVMIPDGYGDTGFQASGVLFPLPACWKIADRFGEASLTFTARRNSGLAREQRGQMGSDGGTSAHRARYMSRIAPGRWRWANGSRANLNDPSVSGPRSGTLVSASQGREASLTRERD